MVVTAPQQGMTRMEADHDERVVYSVAVDADVLEMASVLGEAFAERDPLAIAAGLSVSEFASFVLAAYPRAGSNGISVVARAAKDGAICGVLLADDAADPPPGAVHIRGGKFDPIFDLLAQLEADYRQGTMPQAGESLHLALLGVTARWTRLGLAQGLVAAAVTNGRRLGFGRAVTEATSPTSQHVFSKAGFVTSVSRGYLSYQFEGRAVFRSIAEHGGVRLMDRTLTA